MMDHSWIAPIAALCAIHPAIPPGPAGWRSSSLCRLGEGPQRIRPEDHKRAGQAPRSGETKLCHRVSACFCTRISSGMCIHLSQWGHPQVPLGITDREVEKEENKRPWCTLILSSGAPMCRAPHGRSYESCRPSGLIRLGTLRCIQ